VITPETGRNERLGHDDRPRQPTQRGQHQARHEFGFDEDELGSGRTVFRALRRNLDK
jgi:hypothetical protein